jgi:predicted secreted protein
LADLKVEEDAKDPGAFSAEIVERIMATIQDLK